MVWLSKHDAKDLQTPLMFYGNYAKILRKRQQSIAKLQLLPKNNVGIYILMHAHVDFR